MFDDMTRDTIKKCVVCGGRGIVKHNFYFNRNECPKCNGTKAYVKCKSCSGKGYIVLNFPRPYDPYPPSDYWPNRDWFRTWSNSIRKVHAHWDVYGVRNRC